MSTTKNVFRLSKYYDLVLSGFISYQTTSLQDAGTLWGTQRTCCGALGNNISDPFCIFSSPVQIPGTTWTCIMGGQILASHAIKSNGTLWGWGSNGDFQRGNNWGILGNNTQATCYSSPVQIPGTTWRNIKSVENSVFATKTDGTLWAWGGGVFGSFADNFGDSSTCFRSSPVQIPGTQWLCATRLNSTTVPVAGLKSDNTLWIWGNMQRGESGIDLNPAQISSPVQIPGTQWCAVCGLAYGVMALKNNGTLWTWGANCNGDLGTNSEAYSILFRSSPAQIPGTNWVEISGVKPVARKSDGTLWSWGSAFSGVGDGENIPRSSPVQIPGTSWTSVFSGASNLTFANKNNGTTWMWGFTGNWDNKGSGAGSCQSSPIQLPGSWLGFSGTFGRKIV